MSKSLIVRLAALVCAVVLLAVNIAVLPKINAPAPVIAEPEDIAPAVITETDIEEPEPVEPSYTDISETDVSPADTEKELIEYDIKYPYYITIDKIGEIVSIYTTNEEGKYETLVRQCICSTGVEVNKLPDGIYPIKNVKYKWEKMLSHGDPLYAQYVTKITGSFLFHSVPYTATKKNALDMKRYKKLGTAASGGCIRLTVECAKWIYDNCPAGTPVKVFKGTYDAELVKKLTPAAPKNGWDPTDPDPENPNYQPQYDPSTEPKPYIYAPLYDYNWQFSPECKRIFYDSDDDVNATAPASTAATTQSEAPTEATTASSATQATTASTEATTASTAETTTATTTAATTATTAAATTTTTAAPPPASEE